MLLYTDERTVYRFIRTIANFLASIDARIHFQIDPSQHADIVNTLWSAANGVVEVQEAGFSNSKRR